jgi:hypothetical protein
MKAIAPIAGMDYETLDHMVLFLDSLLVLSVSGPGLDPEGRLCSIK